MQAEPRAVWYPDIIAPTRRYDVADPHVSVGRDGGVSMMRLMRKRCRLLVRAPLRLCPVLLLLLGIPVVTGGCGNEARQPSPSTTSDLSGSAPPPGLSMVEPLAAHRAPDGGEMKVVERGFSTGRDKAAGPTLQYGVIIENTSRRYAALRVEVFVVVVDAAGTRLSNVSGLTGRREVGPVLPGQRTGTGAAAPLGRATARNVDITIGVTWWVPPGHPITEVGGRGSMPLAAVDASDVRIRRDGPEKEPVVTFMVMSRYQQEIVEPAAYVVFRDSNGRIVGGGTAQQGGDDAYPPGSSVGHIVARHGTPVGTDVSRTEVYVSPFGWGPTGLR